MKNKFLTWIVTVLFILPCMVLLSACTGAKESGFKVVVNNQTYTENDGNNLVLDYGQEISYSAVAIFDDNSEKAIDTSMITITDESQIIGTVAGVGDYTVSFKYADYPEIVVNIKVNQLSLEIPTVAFNPEYTGEDQTVMLNNFDATYMNITCNVNKDVGDYTATVSLKDTENCIWADDTITDKTIDWKIEKVQITKPMAKEIDFLYDGESHSLEFIYEIIPNDDLVTITGDLSATNAGDYTVVIALKDKNNYSWDDGTSEDIVVNWSISKLQPQVPSINIMSGTYDPSKTLADYTLPTGFEWEDDTIVPVASESRTYTAIYNPNPDMYEDVEVEVLLTIAKAQAVAPTHAILSGTYDPEKTLSDYQLATGFYWEDSTHIPTVNQSQYQANYNPDPDNYYEAEVNITLNIAKAQAVAPTHFDITINQYDKDIKLSNYNLQDNFTWVDDTINPTCDISEYAVIYNPDPDNYINHVTTITINVSKHNLHIPDIQGRYVYNGEEQTAQVGNFDPELMTITGNKQANSGKHNVVITLTNEAFVNYRFGGEGEGKTVTINWFINKKTPTITIDSNFDKVYDGRGINNPRYTVSDDLEVNISYSKYNHYGTSWSSLKNGREDVVNAGKYKIDFYIEESDNYESAFATKDFEIYYDLSEYQIYTNPEFNYSYTGAALEPQFIVAKEGGYYNPENVLENTSSVQYFTYTYVNYTNYMDGAYIEVTGNKYCRGTLKKSFDITPVHMFKSWSVVGCPAEEINEYSNAQFVFLQDPTVDLNITLNLNDDSQNNKNYTNCQGMFTYIAYNQYDQPIISETVVEITDTTVSFTVPKDTREIEVRYYAKDSYNYAHVFWGTFFVERAQSSQTPANMFIYYIQEINNVRVDVFNQEIILMPNFGGNIAELIAEALTNPDKSELASDVTYSSTSLDNDILTINVIKMEEEINTPYSFDFTIVDMSTGYAAVECVEHIDGDGNSTYLQFNNQNSITISNTISILDSLYFSFDYNGGITSLVITDSEDNVVTSKQADEYGSCNFISFNNIPGADTYTLTAYWRDSVLATYTIVIEDHDDTPYFELTYGSRKFVFNMEGESDIKYKIDLDTYMPTKMYAYLGTIESGNTINISVNSLVTEGYDNNMIAITDFSNITLDVLSDESGNQYCLMYGSFDGTIIPIYLYLYDEPEVVVGEDIKFNFNSASLKFSFTPEVGDITMYGDFMQVEVAEDEYMLVAQLTKSELGYIDGDVTVDLGFEINNMASIVMYDYEKEHMVMAIEDLKNSYPTPVFTIEGETTINYILLVIVSQETYDMHQVMIQIVDNPVAE